MWVQRPIAICTAVCVWWHRNSEHFLQPTNVSYLQRLIVPARSHIRAPTIVHAAHTVRVKEPASHLRQSYGHWQISLFLSALKYPLPATLERRGHYKLPKIGYVQCGLASDTIDTIPYTCTNTALHTVYYTV